MARIKDLSKAAALVRGLVVSERWEDHWYPSEALEFQLDRPYCLQWEELPTRDNSGKVTAYGGIFMERFKNDEVRHRKVVALRERGIEVLRQYEDRPGEAFSKATTASVLKLASNS